MFPFPVPSSFCFLLALPFLAGCAFVDREAELKYSAPPREVAAPAAESMPRTTVAVQVVADRRKETAEVGDIRNGFGMRTAAVKSKGDPVAWVREAVVTEFGRAGFQVVEAGRSSELVVDVQLQTMHCEAFTSYEGDVCLAAKAMHHGRVVVDGVYNGKGSAGVNWSATDESFAETLDLSLQDALLQFTADVRKAMGGGAGAPRP